MNKTLPKPYNVEDTTTWLVEETTGVPVDGSSSLPQTRTHYHIMATMAKSDYKWNFFPSGQYVKNPWNFKAPAHYR